MSKKTDALLTPEELAAKKIRKSNGWTRFWAIVLAVALVFGVFSVAKSNGQKLAASVESEQSEEQNGDNGSAANANASAGWDSGSSSTDNAATPAGDTSNNTATPAGDASSSSNNTATPAGDASSSSNNAAAPAGNDAASVANAINAATAKAASGSYKFHRNCVISNIDVGNATDTLNGIINKVDENADLNSVVGGFLDRGETDKQMPNDKDDIKEKYVLKATKLQAGDLQGLQVSGNKYTFTLPVASNPQKDNSTPLSRFTNDFITFSEVQTGVADALGSFSSLLKVESANVEFKDIKISVTMDNGTLKEIQYSYYMDVKELKLKATLVPIAGTGYGTVEGTYTF